MHAVSEHQSPGAKPLILDRYVSGAGVIALCLVSPISIMILHMLKVKVNPALLMVSAILAAIGLALALADEQEALEGKEGGPPEDEG